MKIIVDVNYGVSDALAAGIVFRDWKDSEALHIITSHVSRIEPYEPGMFYKRELPCIQKVLNDVAKQIGPSLNLKYIVVDSYVWLGSTKPGMGHKLYETLEKQVPVIGVAKKHFQGADNAVKILRGESKSPLFISAVGIDTQEAANIIRDMHGNFRLPTLIKLADSKCRGYA